jgi:integrase
MVINEKFVERLAPGLKRIQQMDAQTTGFGVRCDVNGRKSFFYYAKVGGRVVFKSLGESPSVSVKDARDAARVWSGKATKWKQDGYPDDKNPFAKPKKQIPTTTPAFKELVEAYIERHLRDNALNPERAEYDLRLLVKNYLVWSDLQIDRITTDHVLTAKNSAKGKYARESIVETTRRLFNWSAGKNKENRKTNFWKCDNPAADISLGDRDEPRDRFLQPDELHRFNEQLKEEKHADTRDVLALLMSTGARKSNVYAMKWQDANRYLKQWKIPESKSGFSYTVNLTPAAMEVLERRGWKEKGFVFPANSRSGHIHDIKKRWQLFREKAGIPDVRLHDLRRTRGSYLAIGGVSLQQIGEILGHRSLGSTQIYARLNDEALRSALEVGDATMNRMATQAKKSLKAAKPKATKMLAVANAGR